VTSTFDVRYTTCTDWFITNRTCCTATASSTSIDALTHTPTDTRLEQCVSLYPAVFLSQSRLHSTRRVAYISDTSEIAVCARVCVDVCLSPWRCFCISRGTLRPRLASEKCSMSSTPATVCVDWCRPSYYKPVTRRRCHIWPARQSVGTFNTYLCTTSQ